MPPTPSGPIWGNAIASYGLLQNHIARQVPLGMFTDQNSADTDGHSLALALRGGYDFKIGPFTTGPVAGAVLQQVRINGFTETGTSGVSALSFGSQTRDSAVSQLGWRGSVDLGDWQPFAELAGTTSGPTRTARSSRRSRRSRHRPGPPPQARSPPTGPPPRSAPPTNSAPR